MVCICSSRDHWKAAVCSALDSKPGMILIGCINVLSINEFLLFVDFFTILERISLRT